MTSPTNRDARELKPCPFCGEPPYVREGINGYAHCRTPGCWSNRCQTVSLDDVRQVESWNARALLSPDEVEEMGADQPLPSVATGHPEQELIDEGLKGFALIHTMLETPSIPRQSVGEVAATFLGRFHAFQDARQAKGGE